MSDVHTAEDVVDPNALADQTQPQAPETTQVLDPQTPDPQSSEPVHGNTGRQPWYMKRIADESHGKQEAIKALDAKDRELREAKALLERLQRAGQQPNAQQPVQPPQPQTRGPTQDEVNEYVRSEAQNIVFSQAVNDVRNAGATDAATAGTWGQTVELAGHLGLGRPDVLADLFAVDKANAHVIIDKLVKDPERAAALADMDPRRRIAEFTRMADAEKGKAAPTKEPAAPAAPATKVSKAPPPAPRVQPNTSKTVVWYSDDASDEEFDKGFYDPERLKRRMGRGR